MKGHFLFLRILAIFLSLGLALPNPALALRPSQEGSGLEELEAALKKFSQLLFPPAEPPAEPPASPGLQAGLEEVMMLQRVRKLLQESFGGKAEQLERDDLLALRWALPQDVPDLLDLYGRALGVSLTKPKRRELSGQMVGIGWRRPGVKIVPSLEETFDFFHSWMPQSVREAFVSLLAAPTWDEFISRRLPNLERAIRQHLENTEDEFWRIFLSRLIESASYSAEHERVLLKTAQRVAKAFDPGNPENPQRIQRWLRVTYPPGLRGIISMVDIAFLGEGEAFKRAFKSEVAKRLQGASYSEHIQGELLRFVITASEGGGSAQKLANVVAHEYTHQILQELNLAPWRIRPEKVSESDWIAEASATLIQGWVSEELGEPPKWRPAAGIGPLLNRWLIDQGQQIARRSTTGWTYQLRRILNEIPPSQRHYTTGKLIAGIAWQLGREVSQPQANVWKEALAFVGQFAREATYPPRLEQLSESARRFRQFHGLPADFPSAGLGTGTSTQIGAGLEAPPAGLEELDAQHFAREAQKASVFVVLGQTAFEKIPGDRRSQFRAAVEVLRQTRLGERLIVLPEDPTNEALFEVIVQASQLPDPYFVAYAQEGDPAVSRFIDAVEDSRIPFAWIRWDDEAPASVLYLREILLQLGVPEGVATQEAVERFMAAAGLEQAA